MTFIGENIGLDSPRIPPGVSVVPCRTGVRFEVADRSPPPCCSGCRCFYAMGSALLPCCLVCQGIGWSVAAALIGSAGAAVLALPGLPVARLPLIRCYLFRHGRDGPPICCTVCQCAPLPALPGAGAAMVYRSAMVCRSDPGICCRGRLWSAPAAVLPVPWSLPCLVCQGAAIGPYWLPFCCCR